MVNQEEESKSVHDRVEELTRRKFYVSACPEKVWKS